MVGVRVGSISRQLACSVASICQMLVVVRLSGGMRTAVRSALELSPPW